MDEFACRILHVDAIAELDTALQCILADDRAGLAQSCGLHLRARCQISPVGVQQGVSAIAEMEIVERRRAGSTLSGGSTIVSQSPEP